MDQEKLKTRLDHEWMVARLFEATKGQQAIPGHVIVSECGLSGKAELRILVHRLREDGIPICSNRSGYWYANTDEEITQTVRGLRSRAFSMLYAASRMQKNLLDQEEMDEDILND